MKLFFIVFLIVITASCTNELDKTIYCGNKTLGSFGGEANSIYDDYYPIINPIVDEQSLNFVRYIKDNKKSKKNKPKQELLNFKIYDQDSRINNLILYLEEDFLYFSTPIILEYNGRMEVYFSGNKKSKPANRNIYIGEYNQTTKKIENINIIKEFLDKTNNSNNTFDNSPTISKNGKLLIFASDRKNGIGGLDLYYSIRTKDKWSAPQNMGYKFNTEFDDNYPHLDEEMNLYYSSKVINEQINLKIKGSEAPKIKQKDKIENTKEDTDENIKDIVEDSIIGSSKDSSNTNETSQIEMNYDIFKAIISDFNLSELVWETPIKLTEPINSEFDDICPFISFDNIILSSNRIGGCGGYDLYKFPICKPFLITGKIVSESNFVATNGSLVVYNNEGQIAKELVINKNGNYKIENLLRDTYTLVYTNDCLSDMEMKQVISIPCSEQEVTKFVADFVITKPNDSFDFGEYNVPFFVSGYYKPNTSDNLKELRLLYTYNMLGNSDSTMYIENPDSKYDKYALEIDKAVDNAVDFVIKQLSFSSNLCGKQTKLKIKISITGFTDQRGFSELAKYNGPDINDQLIGFNLSNGTKMSNDLLALMRAYFSADELVKRLKNLPIYKANADNITWNIDIGDSNNTGVTNNTNNTKNNDSNNNNIKNINSNDLQRKVHLSISISEINK